MSTRLIRKSIAALVALVASLLLLVPAASAQDDVLKIGWSQDPQTLNPFIGLDEQNYIVWAINWDLLVNLDPDDLSPAPGIAESWEISDDRKTVTFKIADKKWSDGVPVTSADVKWTLETLGEEGELFAGYTGNVKSIRTPDPKTLVIETTRPDARVIGGLMIYILPKHIWGKVPLSELTTNYQPSLPLVGTGPFIVNEFDRGRTITMDKNPEFSGSEPKFDQIQFIKYGNQDAVERALQLGEIDLIPDVQPSNFERLADEANVETMNSPSVTFTELAFNMCPKEICPDANVNPAIQDLPVRQALAYAIDRERINQIAASGTSFVANGLLPSSYKDFYQEPEETYPFDPERANEILDEAGYLPGDDGIREKGDDRLSFNLYTRTRSEAAYDAQAAKLVAEMAREVGIEFKVQEVSVDKLTELTVRHVDGKPAPDFDSFIWAWTGDAYDPSLLLGLMTTDEIGGSSDSFYSNPEYDKLFSQQAGEFDVEKRKALIHQMVNIVQRDLPYLVLTEDPNLQAYRSDRIANVNPVCPTDGGDIFCEQAGYEPLLDLAPASETTSGEESGGSGGAVIAVIVAAVVLLGGFFFWRSRRRSRDDALEEPDEEPLEESER